jgi:hypothetical protein
MVYRSERLQPLSALKIKGHIMLPISRLGSALKIQEVLSLATNNFVTKQSIIHQATAIAGGFDSFEQALAVTIDMIKPDQA